MTWRPSGKSIVWKFLELSWCLFLAAIKHTGSQLALPPTWLCLERNSMYKFKLISEKVFHPSWTLAVHLLRLPEPTEWSMIFTQKKFFTKQVVAEKLFTVGMCGNANIQTFKQKFFQGLVGIVFWWEHHRPYLVTGLLKTLETMSDESPLRYQCFIRYKNCYD